MRNPKPACFSNSTPRLQEFQSALENLLGLELDGVPNQRIAAFRAADSGATPPTRRPRSVSPGEEFKVRVHVSGLSPDVHLAKTWFETPVE